MKLINLKFKFPKIDISVQLILLFILTICFGDMLPLLVKSTLYAISASLKEILILTLPLIIFSCLFNSMVSNQGRAFSFVLIVLFFVCASNFISILAGYGFALTLPKLSLPIQTDANLSALTPWWSFKLPELLTNMHALLFGLILGGGAIIFRWKFAAKIGKKLNNLVTLFLKKCFVPVLPLFALGFIIKMQHEGILTKIIQGYLPIIIVLLVANLIYLTLMFGVAAKFNYKHWFYYIRNVIPAGFLAFTTMSSLATMPLTLEAAEKNTDDPELSRAIIPATVNIHMVGDSLVIPIISIAILLNYGLPMPNFIEFLIFTQLFMIAKFTIPAVPSGTILVMLPILEQQLGFTSEMSAFVLAVYILFDSIATAGNVLGNSALVIMLTRVMKRISRKAKDMLEIENLRTAGIKPINQAKDKLQSEL